jgi:hypothetical protein
MVKQNKKHHYKWTNPRISKYLRARKLPEYVIVKLFKSSEKE